LAIEVVRIGQSVLLSIQASSLSRRAALAQVKVLGLPHFQVGAAADGRARVDQVGRVKLLGAVFALVAAGGFVAAVRAGAGDVAVGQEAVVVDGEDLLFADFSRSGRFRRACPAKCWVRRWFRWLEDRPKWSNDRRKPGDLGLNGVHFGAIFLDRLARPWRRPARRGCRVRRWRR
jgi:hypothetical protein